MLTVIVSFFIAILSGTFLLLILNYSVYLWENKRIADLTSKLSGQQKSSDDEILEKKNASRGFTARDMFLEGVSKSKSILPVNHQERKVIFIDNDDKPKWLNQVLTFFRRFQTNFRAQLKNVISYLINLAIPEENEVSNTATDQPSNEVFEVIQKVQEDSVEDIPPEVKINQVLPGNQVVVVNPKPARAAENSENSENKVNKKQDEVFTKLEDKLLKKLKEVGMNHFDIWLELGKLYEKYDEPQNAKEIYSLVLKHGHGKEQEFAKNRLIEIT